MVPGPLPDSAVMTGRVWDRLEQVRPGARTLLWFGPNTQGTERGLSRPASNRRWGVETDPSGTWPDPSSSGSGPFPCPEPARGSPLGWNARPGSSNRPRSSSPPSNPTWPSSACRIWAGRPPVRARRSRRRARDPRPGIDPGAVPPVDPDEVLLLAVTESVSTPVSGPVFPNRVLRALRHAGAQSSPGRRPGHGPGAEFGLRPDRSPGRAISISMTRPRRRPSPRPSPGCAGDGVATVAPGTRKAELGLDHARSGDVVLVSAPDRWFAPDWWASPEERPRSEAASGLLAVGASGPVGEGQVKGSLGAPHLASPIWVSPWPRDPACSPKASGSRPATWRRSS